MFQVICSLVMFSERQRPINSYGIVAFFSKLGNCNYSQRPQWFARNCCYGRECDSTSSGGQCYHRLAPWLIPNNRPNAMSGRQNRQRLRLMLLLIMTMTDGSTLPLSAFTTPSLVSSPLWAHSQQHRLVETLCLLPLIRFLSWKNEPSTTICHASPNLRNRRTLP